MSDPTKHKTLYDALLYALLNLPPGVVSQSVGAKARWIQEYLEEQGFWFAPQQLTAEQEEMVLEGLSMPSYSVAPPGRESITAFLMGYTNLRLTMYPDQCLKEIDDAPTHEQ